VRPCAGPIRGSTERYLPNPRRLHRRIRKRGSLVEDQCRAQGDLRPHDGCAPR
jgi:hypothetical protein